MENSKRRRGISLSHQQRPNSQANISLDRSAYIDNQPTTRLQYPRYHLLQSPSRHASAPKAKVHFAYPLHPSVVTSIRTPIRYNDLPTSQQGIYVPPSPAKFVIGVVPPPSYKPIEEIQQQKMSETLLLPANIPSLEKQEIKQDVTAKINQCQTNIDITEKYSSYQQCKQVIGRRLFGAGSIVRRENALQQSDRANRWMQENKKETKILKTSGEQSKKQKNISLTSIQQTVREVMNVNETVEISKKRQLNIQHEVVNLAAENISTKENAPTITLAPISPPVKKEYRKGRDPLKLQEMEKRLMQIIKICDQNLA